MSGLIRLKVLVIMFLTLLFAGYSIAQNGKQPSVDPSGGQADNPNGQSKKMIRMAPLVVSPTPASPGRSDSGGPAKVIVNQFGRGKFKHYSTVKLNVDLDKNKEKTKVILHRPGEGDEYYPETPDDEPVLGQDVNVDDIENKLKAIPPIPSNIKQYLEDKYVRLNEMPSVTLQMSPHYGQQIEYIWISGDITPKDVEKAAKFIRARSEASREDKARALAKAFMEEESELLGIHDLRDIYETKNRTNEYGTGTYTDVYYVRKIGDLELENSDIRITMGPSETISHVAVQNMSVAPDLYRAAKKKTLSKEKIYNIIMREMKAAKPNIPLSMQIFSTKKIVVSKPPYIIWKVRAGTGPFIPNKRSPQSITAPLPGESDSSTEWDYRIDAFTGEILSKASTIRH